MHERIVLEALNKGGFGPLSSMMDLVSFENTRFGDWIVKLSYIREQDSFVLVAFHLYNFNVTVKAFKEEVEVVNFVNYLGERYE